MRDLLLRARSVFRKAVFLLLAVGVTYIAYQALYPVPDVGRALPSEFAEADKVFAERVAEKYVPPMPEAELISRLRADHFAISESGSYAEFIRGWFVCSYQMRILWNSEDGIVTGITGHYGVTCL